MDEIVRALNGLSVIYFRPYGWLPALRIELPSTITSSNTRLSIVLEGVTRQFFSPAVIEPYPLFLADRMVKSLGSGVAVIEQAVAQHIAGSSPDIENTLLFLIAQSASSLSTQQSANVLVMLDEAHRHAPSGKLNQDSEAERLRLLLRRAVRETRKYGLATGSEFDRLKDFADGDKRSLELYQSFRDPQSFPARHLQDFPFMAVGSISPLAFSGKPVFFNMFTDMKRFLGAGY